MFTEIIIHAFENNGKPATLRERLEMRKTCGPYRWTPTEPMKGRGFYQSSKGLWCGDSTFDLRLVFANDAFSYNTRLANTDGYYTDSFCDQTLQPIVARLPHSRGFLAGWTMGAGMCASLDSHIYTDIDDAARAAHSMADSDAAKERERESEDVDNTYEEDNSND